MHLLWQFYWMCGQSLFFFDIQIMGEKSGIEFVKIIVYNFQIPFLFLTSNTETTAKRKALETPLIGYTTKPYTPKERFVAFEMFKTKQACRICAFVLSEKGH